MNISDLLRKVAVYLERKQDALFSYSVEKQKEYLRNMGQPQDEIERSYFQYKCQMEFNGWLLSALINLVSFPMAVLFLLKRKKKEEKVLNICEACFFRDGKPENILPISLKKRYKQIESNPEEGCILSKKDRHFVRELIKRYPFSWHFIFKCIIKVGRYSFAIEKYDPKAIIVCAEYSFTSSVLTLYCRRRNVKHIDIMHGEKLYYMRDSFFEFDECYVWDAYYADLLKSLKASEKQFVVEVPESLRFTTDIERKVINDFTYYLADENEVVLEKIANILRSMYEKGKRISVRPHPRYSNLEVVNRLFSYADIQDTKEITIEQSLLQTGAAISLYSTVLNQAKCNSIPVVIDDMSNPVNFHKLDELKYICLNKEHQLLSDIVEGK